MPQARLVALDWGTSSLRAFLLGDGGACLEERVRPWGIMHLPEGGFEAALQGIAGDWLQAPCGAAGPGLRHGRQRPGLARGALCAVPGGHRQPGRAD